MVNLINCPLFYINNNVTYPPFKNGFYMEEYFLDYMIANNLIYDKQNRLYLPVLWTNFQIQGWFNQKQYEMQYILDNYIKENPCSNGYFTMVQHDDGPKLRLPENTIVYGACTGDIILPLIYEDIKCELLKNAIQCDFNNKNILCSFVGSITHNIRSYIKEEFSNNNDYFIKTTENWTDNIDENKQTDFISVTCNSKFAFAPRGYGRSSFRFFEILKLGVIPIYVWDDIEWLPYKDTINIDYSKFCISIHINDLNLNKLDDILKNIDKYKYNSMLSEYNKVKHMFELEEMCKYISLKNSYENINIKNLDMQILDIQNSYDNITYTSDLDSSKINISLCILTKDRYDTFLSKSLKKYVIFLEEGYIQELIISCENGNDYQRILSEYKELLNTDSRFRIYKNDKVLGVFLNKIKVCSYATSDYIALIDSDNFANCDYFIEARKYISNLNENNLDNSNYSIFAPYESQPRFKYDGFKNEVLSINNIQNFVKKDKFDILLNTGNYILTKNIIDNINNINYNEWELNKVHSCDVIFFNLLCFKQLKDFKFHIVEKLVYNHIVHDKSLYFEKRLECNDYYNTYVLPEFQKFKNYIILKSSGRLGNSFFRYFAYCLLKIKIDEYFPDNKYEYISDIDYTSDINNDFIFYKGVDLCGDDIKNENNYLNIMKNIALSDNNIKCFNTLGFFKNVFNIKKLKSNEYINDYDGLNNGLYVKNRVTINNSNFEYYIENIHQLIGKNIYLEDFFQFDYIYLKYKSEIINHIRVNSEKHYLYEDNYYGTGHRRYLIQNFINININDKVMENENKKYNLVIHIRLGDFNGRLEFIEFEWYEKVLNRIKKQNPELLNFSNCIVIDKINDIRDKEYIGKLLTWFENNNIKITVESNDILTDFHIMKNSEILICSMSTFSWCSAYFSNKLQICYMPNYNFYNLFQEKTYFKKPIQNTILYDVKTTNSLMKGIKVIVLTLKDSIYSRLDELQGLIMNLSKIGLDVEIYNGIVGSDIKIYPTETDSIKLLYHKFKTMFYDNTKRINEELMKSGELGCAWSKLNIYHKLIQDADYDKYLILEDDACLLKNLNELRELLLNLPPDFDLCHIALSDWNKFKINNKVNDYFYTIKRNYFNRCTAYILSKNGAKKVLEYTGNKISVPADDLLCHTYLYISNFKFYVPESEYFHIREDNKSVIAVINSI